MGNRKSRRIVAAIDRKIQQWTGARREHIGAVLLFVVFVLLFSLLSPSRAQPAPEPTFTDTVPAECDGTSTVWGCRDVTINGLPCKEKWCIGENKPVGSDPAGPRAIYCPRNAT